MQDFFKSLQASYSPLGVLIKMIFCLDDDGIMNIIGNFN